MRKASQKARESLRLEPDSQLSYGYLAYSYIALNRFSEAQDAANEALAKWAGLSPTARIALPPRFLGKQLDRNGATGSLDGRPRKAS